MLCDIAVIGGSLGGVQAARAALLHGKSVYLCEETDWIGGQLTSQGVPPDEHPWIESCGATASYRAFREAVRAHYRALPEASARMRMAREFCPGGSWVSRVAHEPRVALALLEASLAPYRASGQLTLELNTGAVAAETEGDLVRSVTVRDFVTGKERRVEAAYFLDATDCGDLLPLTHTESRVGADSAATTGELHAPAFADPDDLQAFTWVAALELAPPDGLAPMPRPALYDLFSQMGTPTGGGRLLDWTDSGPPPRRFSMFDGEQSENPLGLWSYRRIIDPRNYTDGRREVILLNWPQNDYAYGAPFGKDGARHRELARQLTLSLVYWLRTEAPRADGGRGYPVRLRPDILGTADGLAKAPYIREGRRIAARRTICEPDISCAANPSLPHFTDSVGVGAYPMDIHRTVRSHNGAGAAVWPFEIPLSAMIPIRVGNLLPACKNIGVTHLTNGCYRLHPVEWNIGESAGHLAAFCLERGVAPARVEGPILADFQAMLAHHGVQLHWTEEQLAQKDAAANPD